MRGTNGEANNATHKTFLEMRALWVKSYNDEQRDSPSSRTALGKKLKRLSLRSQNDLKSRYVEVRKRRTSGFEGRDRHFVEEEFWNPKTDGVFDKSKVVDEIIFGQNKRRMGVYGQGGCVEGDIQGTDKR